MTRFCAGAEDKTAQKICGDTIRPEEERYAAENRVLQSFPFGI